MFQHSVSRRSFMRERPAAWHSPRWAVRLVDNGGIRTSSFLSESHSRDFALMSDALAAEPVIRFTKG
jgi:hypothetical protein